MISLEAPYPDVQAMLVLPEPNLGNSRATTSKIQTKTMMDGSIETYVMRRTQNVYRFSVTIPKVKALEVLNFLEFYSGSKIRYKDIGRTTIGFLLNNPTELEMQRRAVSQNSNEDVDLELSLEETE